jgi:hypothetical protein
MPKYVFGSRADPGRWNNSTALDGDLVQAANGCARVQRRDIVVHGRAQLTQEIVGDGVAILTYQQARDAAA